MGELDSRFQGFFRVKESVMNQPVPGQPNQDPHIMVRGQELRSVDSFTYLGSTLSRAVNIDTEINNRIAKASSTFGRLRETVWEWRGLSLITKLKVYPVVVLTTLLYTCETWTVYSRHAKQLNRFHLSCRCRLLRIKWQDKTPDTEVLDQAGIPSIHSLLQQAQIRWAGHVVRMTDSRLPKQLLYGELCEGKRSVGGQKKRYKDCIKASLQNLNINVSNWEQPTTNRTAWNSKIFTGVRAAEKRRTAEAQQKPLNV